MVRPARTAEDIRLAAQMAAQIWTSSTVQELEEDLGGSLDAENAVCFIKFENCEAVGFAQCSLRTDYVEGTDTSPVGYLEGIYVDKKYHRRGFAKELLDACEAWAKEKGCTQFASDCELENEDSLHFHLAVGFEEANCIICFKKNI